MVEADIPGLEPVSLVEAKAWLRVEHSAEDALIAGLIRTARTLCEAFTRQALIARGIRETVAARGDWQRLGVTPVRAITAVTALDGSPADRAETDIDANGDGWVRVRPSTLLGMSGFDQVRVTYSAGLASDWNGVAEPLRQGIIRLVAHLYATRDGTGEAGPPAAVSALWRPWRRMRLG